MNKSTIKPRISLVGAGPGDPDLITRKGLKALHSADVVLYDALIAEELILEAPDHALKIYVGKRANNHRYSQKEMNLMMVQMAYQYGHVVRLKGGDPLYLVEDMKSYNLHQHLILKRRSSLEFPAVLLLRKTRGYH